ncbi:MAG: rod shape-determining protein RodA [Bacteroidetes bacterium]|nr:MAG: rod shape-determining protein RodA [Bacteroidota bacterium]
MKRRGAIFSNIDPVLVILYLILVFLGWINIYTTTYSPEKHQLIDLSVNHGKQLLWIGTSFFLIALILLTDSKFFSSFSYAIYVLLMGMLLVVLVVGKEVAGSRSWFQIGSFAIQPSEFAKVATCLALAKYLSSQTTSLEKFRHTATAFTIMLLPAAFIFLQNDTGSALVYASLILVLYREGFSPAIFILAVLVVLLFILTLLLGKYYVLGGVLILIIGIIWLVRKNRKALLTLIAGGVMAIGFIFTVDYTFEHILEPHQKTRINVLLGIEDDLYGAGYNVHQSKIAIGSGGLWGKGFLQGTQTKFNFVPEQSTDFIFCTLGEEWGFLGTTTLIALFLGLLIRIIYIAERQRSSFSRIYGYGVASILFFHFAINIGMTIGLVPVIGIPLPFFSYGGSSLWAFSILLFIFIKMDSYRLDIL